MPTTINKNIILVGPGHLPIPVDGPNGWGGIENILTWIIKELEQRNQQFVLINNKDNFISKIKDMEQNVDSIIHVHYDDYAPHILKNCKSFLISTSHSPYHPFKELWQGNIFQHFYSLFFSINAYFGQSTISNNNAISLNKNLKLGLCRCGIPDELFACHRKENGNNKSLVIGKIEPRKNQALLQHHFANDLHMDFVGQVSDSNFIPQNVGKSRYLGTWSREEVVKNMSDYSSIILLSSFEGDVVIVKEALAAGCSLVISDNAALNVDKSLPYVKIVSNDIDKKKFISLVEKTNEENKLHRKNILNYFTNNFEIKKTVDEYIESLKNLYA